VTAPAQESNERWWVYQSDSGGDPESTWIMKGPKEDEPDVYANAVATIRFDDLDVAERIVAEHNALLGCPDPKEFIDWMDKLIANPYFPDEFPTFYRHMAWLGEDKK